MTRINTNVPSLIAQNRLQTSNRDLQTALTRLSTGLRINTGSDDPAGLIASEALRSEITSINKSISNTRRASQIISTADSALGQVSSLLNDIRGLVVEAANSGALSPDEIAANQLQVDSSLEAINRIAQTTTFQGRKLLDGSLDFITTNGAGASNLNNVKIDQANLGATGSVAVTVSVAAAATRAAVDITGFGVSAPAVASSATLAINPGVTGVPSTPAAAASNTIAVGTDFLQVTANDAGVAGNSIQINFITGGAGPATAAFNVADSNIIEVTIDATAGNTSAEIVSALNGLVGTTVTAALAGASTGAQNATSFINTTLQNGADLVPAVTAVPATTIAVSNASGENIAINFVDSSSATTPTAAIVSGALQVTYNQANATSASSIASAISSVTGFTATVTGSGSTTAGALASNGSLTGGSAAVTGGVAANVVFELAGKNGSEVFNISQGTSLAQVVSQINLVSDATGVGAVANGTTLELRSSDFGSDATVDLRILSQGAGGNFGTGSRGEGDDIIATVNGRAANGTGNKISINTATLDLTADLTAGFVGDASFSIVNGGAQFQLGPEVVSNQQARVGISSVNSARLGGVSGKLFQLGSGEFASLATNPTLAARIVSESIDQITSLRGRLGAFQATTLESNLTSLNDTVANLQEAESSIRDADFAQESANLTRAQILVQSGTNVLALANQNPQNVLSLLR